MQKTNSVCIMTSVHRYDDVRIYHKEAKALKQVGYDVTLLCSNHKGKDVEWYDENGIRFIKIDVPKKRSKRVLHAWKGFYKKALELNCDYYHFHDPELIKAGLKLRKKARVIYDIHEDVPRQILTKPYLKPFIAKISSWFVERYEEYSAKRFYAIIAAEPVIYERLININPNTVMVCNYPKLDEFQIVDDDFSKRQNAVCYIGGITKIRGIFEMIDAVNDTDYKLILAGEYETDELKIQAEQKKGYENVDYKGFLDRQGVKETLSTVKAGLVTLHPIPKYLTALPVKMFEYMIAKVPVISSDFPYWKQIVDDASCGVCVDPLNPDEIKKAIKYIIDNPDVAKQMGENGRKKVLEKYNWDIEKKKLIALYAK